MHGSAVSNRRLFDISRRPSRIVLFVLTIGLLAGHPWTVNAQGADYPACAKLSNGTSPSLSTKELVNVIGRSPTNISSQQGLANRIVREGNRLSNEVKSPSSPSALSQAGTDLIFLDDALSKDVTESNRLQRGHLRLTMSSVYLKVGCRSEAVELLERSLELIPNGSLALTAALTNIGVLQVELDRLDAARKSLVRADDLLADTKPTSYLLAKVRLGLLSALARLERKSGYRQKAAELHRSAIAILDSAEVKKYFEDSGATDEYNHILTNELVNRAILLGYEQKPQEAVALFERAFKIVQDGKAPATDLPELLIAWSDNCRDLGNTDCARGHLDRAIDILGKRGRIEVLLRALQKRAELEIAAGQASRAVEDLERIDQLLSSAGLTPLEKAKITSTRATLFQGMGKNREALLLFARALSETREAAPEASLEVAQAYKRLSVAAARDGEMDRALEEARSADKALTAWLAEEAAGCQAGKAPNKEIIAEIREWRGLMAALKRQSLQKRGAPEAQFRETDRDFFDLVQERELDRVGVAAQRSVMRVDDSGILRNYQTALSELCAARADFDEAVRVQQPDLATPIKRIERAQKDFAKEEEVLGPDVRARFAIGHLKVELEDLPDLLNDGEALIAFRVGGSFSLVFIASRRGNAVVTASVIARKSTAAAVSKEVSGALAVRDNASKFRAAIERLGQVIDLADVGGMFEGATQIFVVADGGLQRLPAHLLPIGNVSLGDVAPTSALSSLSMLAALRSRPHNGAIVRTLAGFGAPLLDSAKCPTDPAITDPRQLVQCLGKAYGAQELLAFASRTFQGPAPIAGLDLTKEKIRAADLSNVGILLFATHGLVGGDRYSKIPAIVLSPMPGNNLENGLLSTTEISNLKLDGIWLAIIAACHTAGAAPDSLEEGLSGLGLAFITAGAKALVLSYWDAEASSTLKLLQRFLQLLAEKPELSLSGALAVAMQDLRKDGRYAPDQWAAFVVIGDGTIRPPK